MLLVPEFTLQLQASGVYRGLRHFPRIRHGIGIKHFPAHWILTTSYYLCLGIIEAVKFYEAGLDPEALSVGFQIHTFQNHRVALLNLHHHQGMGAQRNCAQEWISMAQRPTLFSGMGCFGAPWWLLTWCAASRREEAMNSVLAPQQGNNGRFLKYHNSHLIRQENPFLPLSEQFQETPFSVTSLSFCLSDTLHTNF